jgi:hypothetical protein
VAPIQTKKAPEVTGAFAAEQRSFTLYPTPAHQPPISGGWQGRGSRGCYLLNTALTDVFLIITTVQVGCVPRQAPPHFENVLPCGGVAVNVTEVPDKKFAEQVPPQSMPDGLLVTVPVLLFATDSV